MKRFLLIPLLLLALHSSHAQKTDPILDKAMLFYQNDEFEMAIPLFVKLSEQNPRNAEILKDLGKCYVQTGKLGEGIARYKQALEIRPDLADAAYGLGNAYDISNIIDSALFWFREYTLMNPDDPSGFIRLSVIYMDDPEQNDSSVFYAQKALLLEPSNQRAYYTLAMAYVQNDKYNQAIDAAVKGLSYDSTAYLLYYPWGLSLFFQHNYGLAYKVFSKGVKFENQGSDLTRYRAMSLIMKNTPPDVYNFDASGQPRFQILNEHNMDVLGNRITDPLDRYYYPALLKKFNEDLFSMGLDEFFMLYYGYSGSKEYSPYNLRTDSLDHFLSLAQYDLYIRHAETYLSDDQTMFPIYDNLAMVYNINGNDEKHFENLFEYFGFRNGVMASGDGEGPGTAYVITNVNHEYEILRSLGLQPAGQKLVEDKNHSYDVLSAKAVNGDENEIWFNIDKPYLALELLMKERQRKRKK